MKLAYCRQGINDVYDSLYGAWNENDPEDNLVSKIFENMKNFEYVDSNGAKIVDIIFQMYCEEIDRFNVSMGEKLLKLGAKKDILEKALSEALNFEGYYREIYDSSYIMEKILNRLVETGVDLESTVFYDNEEIPMKDRVYLAAAEYGNPYLLKRMIEEGADLFINFDSSLKKSSIDLCMKKPDSWWRPEKADNC